MSRFFLSFSSETGQLMSTNDLTIHVGRPRLAVLARIG
ncbi:hypothetical protein R69888_00101 [Paraburkholderia haematera]|uniref:LysR family transcriptional regulator n=1 Tax=Paraburkholderia haematera TaxID=2793077 RepID=A0ABM8QBQ1_9BURK|nr:hypothetical protein R69888_00101 [Paraburkholderia haematera]